MSKRRRKALFGQARRQLGQILHGLARQKGARLWEVMMPDHAPNHVVIADRQGNRSHGTNKTL